MSSRNLPYDDLATTLQMHADCVAVGRELRVPGQRYAGGLDTVLGATVLGATRPGYEVSDELADLAAGLELHLT